MPCEHLRYKLLLTNKQSHYLCFMLSFCWTKKQNHNCACVLLCFWIRELGNVRLDLTFSVSRTTFITFSCVPVCVSGYRPEGRIDGLGSFCASHPSVACGGAGHNVAFRSMAGFCQGYLCPTTPPCLSHARACTENLGHHLEMRH